jgi:hypothetical protein
MLSDDVDEVFLRSDSAVKGGQWMLLGGGALIVCAMVGFALAIVTKVDQIQMHFMTTGPLIIGVGLLAAGWGLTQSPLQVAVGPSGVAIEGRKNRQKFTWDQIGWASVGTAGMSGRKVLSIYDTRGKRLAMISDAFEGFDTLAGLVTTRASARTDGAATKIQASKSRRNAWLSFATGLGLAAAAIGIATFTWSDMRSQQLLAEKGVPGEGEVVRRFMAPDGVTARLEYRVKTPEGIAPKRNAEVERAYWDRLEGATTVPVIHVPGEPGISRLAEGEVADDDVFKTPVGGFGLAGLGGLMSLFLLGIGVMQFLGWDIDIDSKTGVPSLKRYGQGS